jgi:hypothetical protein
MRAAKDSHRYRYVIALHRGDSIVKSLTEFCKEKKIKQGFFIGIGAVDFVELAHYSVENKKYSSKKFELPLEMVSLVGNVVKEKGKDLIVHAHGTFGKDNFETISGHLVEAKISGVGEIIFFPTQTKLEKSYDDETGLKIIQKS